MLVQKNIFNKNSEEWILKVKVSPFLIPYSVKIRPFLVELEHL